MIFPGESRPRKTFYPLTTTSFADVWALTGARKLAFLGYLGVGQANVFLVDLDADYLPRGEPRQLTHEPCYVSNPMWTGPTGHPSREVLYVKHGRDITTLLRVPADGSGQPQPVHVVTAQRRPGGTPTNGCEGKPHRHSGEAHALTLRL